MSISLGRRVSVLAAVALSAFMFNTTESLPIGLLQLMAGDLHVSLPAVGLLVSGYGLVVAVVSLPLAHWTRHLPRRHVLAGVLGLLAAASLVSVLASSYAIVLGSRIVVALAQALFWAVMGATAVGQFSPAVRGRVLGVLSACGSLAILLGVPAGTWLGQHSGWRAPFVVIGIGALAAAALVAVLLPTSRPEESHAAFGSAPNRWQFAVVLATTVLTMTGLFTGFTYVVEFLTGTTGLAQRLIGVLLFVYGLAGLLGVTVFGQLLDRWPRGALLTAVSIQGTAMLTLSMYSDNKVVVIGSLAVLGAASGPIFMATQARILHVAPGRTEIGFAANSGAFNVGVAAGALLGGILLAAMGARSTFLAGAALTMVALGLLLVEPLRVAGRSRGSSVRNQPLREPT
ncbi:MFS transporter [Dactylosporangium sp. NPDC051485]|uniref:MFS transporter n=1 Tax=Dactylosporangium sp. NPDC051485 TaxID=3154846 RepID=UPI00343BBCF3